MSWPRPPLPSTRALGLKLDEDPSLELLAAEFALFRDGDSFFDGGGIDKLKRLAKLLVAAGDEGGAARALTLLGTAAWARADRKGALSYLDEAVNRYESLPESLNQAEALLELARVHMTNFETAPAVAAAEAAEDIANRLALAEISANARITSAMARCFAGDPAGPLELAAITEHCRAHGLVSRRRAIQNLAWVTQEEGDLMRAAMQLSEQHLLAAKGGLTLSPVSHSYQANAFFGGDWRRSISETAQALRQPSREWDQQAILSTAWIKVICGEDDQGTTVDEILASARQSGFHRPLRTACAHTALYQALKGEHDAALTLLAELEADWRQAIALPFAEWVSAAGHAAHLTGEPGRALFLRVLGAAPRLTPWAEAAVATAQGEHLRAARIYQEIGDVSDRMLSLGWGAQTGQLAKGDEAELRDFATRNSAKLLMPPDKRAKRRRPA